MRSWSSALRLLQQAGACQQQTLSTVAEQAQSASSFCTSFVRAISSSVAAPAAAATATKAQGDVDSLLSEIDRVVSSESAGAKEVSDAAVALAYLQAKGNRRLWGKVFEKVPSVQSGFDATSLTSFLWAATTAGVGHFKTIADLSGTVSRLLPGLSPTQVSLAVEGMGRVGAKDEELLSRIAGQVSGNIGAYKPADLARLVWGFAAAGSDNGKLVAAAAKALSDKAGELTGREVAQATWGLARLRYADKATYDTLVRAARNKLESGVDAAGLAWALGFIGYKADAETVKAIATVLKNQVADLTPAHAVDAVWGLSLLGGDRDTAKKKGRPKGSKALQDASTALFNAIAAAVDSAPDCLDPYQLASVYEAAAAAGAKAPEQLTAYAAKMNALVEEGARGKRSAGLKAFKDDLAQSVARAMGAQYRPEIAAEVESYSTVLPDGIIVDISLTADANTKVAVEAVGTHYLSSAATPLGPAVARAKLLESKGYKVVLVTAVDWARLATPQDKAQYLLGKLTTAAPGIKSKVGQLKYKA